VGVDPADALAPQAPRLNSFADDAIGGLRDGRQTFQQLKGFAAPGQVAASQLAQHHGMRGDFAVLQQQFKTGVAAAKVVDPN
jgi:hypothetical protein